MEATPRHPQASNLQAIAIIQDHGPARLLVTPFIKILLGRVVELHHGAEAGCLAFFFVQSPTYGIFIIIPRAIPVNTRPLIRYVLIRYRSIVGVLARHCISIDLPVARSRTGVLLICGDELSILVAEGACVPQLE